jgi:hypothetical protein
MARCTDCDHLIDKCHDTNFNYVCGLTGATISDSFVYDDAPCTSFSKKEEKKVATTRKTKDELMTELEAKETEIKELKEDLKKLEKYKQYEDTANEIKALHDAFMNSGFSDEQAFALVNNIMTTATAGVVKNPLAFLR